MIFRAMVSAYPKGLPERAQDERVVFIEAANRDDARDRLPDLAATVWRVPVESVEIYNLEPDFELMASPLAEGLPREHAIFVIGHGDGKPIFVNGERACGHAVFFLASELNRLMNAYMSLPRDALAGNQSAQPGPVIELSKVEQMAAYYEAPKGFFDWIDTMRGSASS